MLLSGVFVKRMVGLLLSTASSMPLAALAQSDIFVCTDEHGQKTFQNIGSAKSCKRVDVGPVLTLPAVRQPAAPQASEPRATASPANFPRVDRDTQRTRDSDRKRILEDELKTEEEKLARLRFEFNNGEPERRGDERNFALYQERAARLRDDVARVEANVNALRREIALLRTQ